MNGEGQGDNISSPGEGHHSVKNTVVQKELGAQRELADKQSIPYFAHEALIVGHNAPQRDTFLDELSKPFEKGERNRFGFGDISDILVKEKEDFNNQFVQLQKETSIAREYFKNNPNSQRVALYALPNDTYTTDITPGETATATHFFSPKDTEEGATPQDGIPSWIQTATESANKLKEDKPLNEDELDALPNLITLLKVYADRSPQKLKPMIGLLNLRISAMHEALPKIG